MRHAEIIDKGYDVEYKYTNSLGPGLQEQLQKSKASFADLNPEAVIRGGTWQFGVGSNIFLLGEAEGQDKIYSHNAWGIEEPPKVQILPDIFSSSRPYIEAHNDSLPKTITRNVPPKIPQKSR
jgi:hypothetical protein